MHARLALLSLLLSSTALAQAPSPAQLGITQTTPQTLNVLDSTKTWVPVGTVSSGAFRPVIGRDPRDPPWNAKCDGATDDTLALQSWASSTPAYAALTVQGTCLFKDRITFPVVSGVTIAGSGHPSKLLYAGASTTLDPIIQIGVRPNNGCTNGVTGWTISGVTFMSNTVMTAGDGLRINGGCLMHIYNLTVGSSLGEGNANFFNAVRLEGGNSVHAQGFVFRGSNDALAISGDLDALHYMVEPSFLQGQLVWSKVGLHLCGGAGGGLFDSIDTINNGTNVLIDRSCVNLAQTQHLFGPHFMSDVTNGSPGIGFHVSDPGGTASIIRYMGWLASATNQCFLFDAGTPDNPSVPPMVAFQGAVIGNCHAPTSSNGGIENQSTYAQFSFQATRFFTSQGSRPTIYNVAGAPSMNVQGLVKGVDPNFNIAGAFDGVVPTSSGSLFVTSQPAKNVVLGAAGGSCGVWLGVSGFLPALTDGTGAGCSLALGAVAFPFTALYANTVAATGTGADIQWRPQGGTQPTDQKNWDILENSATGDLALRALNDAFGAANTYVSYVRGSGYSLTGAKMTVSVPLQVAGYTIATLPACVTGQGGLNAFVTNGQASPPYLGAVSTTGTTVAPVFCTGAGGWVYH